MFACILGVITGFLQNQIQPKTRMITMGDRFSSLELKFFNFPDLDSRKLSKLFTSS